MEPTTDNRKTFRLEAAAAKTLEGLKTRHSTENAAINHVLTRWPIDMAKQQENILKLNGEVETALKDGRVWRGKYEATRDELEQLKNSLALIGKFLNPAE